MATNIQCSYLYSIPFTRNFKYDRPYVANLIKCLCEEGADYLLFVGTCEQFPSNVIDYFREINAVVHFATDIVNMNYSPKHNPRLAYLLLRNNDAFKQFIGAQV